MTEIKNYCFVVDCNGRPLSPTKENRGWYLIRKGKASLFSKYPMVIQLKKAVETDVEDSSRFICGIDDGSKYVGFAVVQKGETQNKVVFKGTLEQRQDVKNLMDARRGYRRYRRAHKRYRKARFDNRSASKREDRIAPSIKQKREATLRIIKRLLRYIPIHQFVLEDVAIDIRALTEGAKLYKWEYQRSNRLDENLRKAVMLRDKNECRWCKASSRLEAHHIVPRRLKGADTIKNLIALCDPCHEKTKGVEEQFIDLFQKMIEGVSIRFDYAQHVMQGKNYLRRELASVAKVTLTTGGDTANRRIDLGIEKTHSNDAIIITGLFVRPEDCQIKDWILKPIRKKSKAKTDHVLGIRHRDLVAYTFKNGERHVGYVTALYPSLNALNFQSRTKHCKKVSAKKCELLWKYDKIYWLESV